MEHILDQRAAQASEKDLKKVLRRLDPDSAEDRDEALYDDNDNLYFPDDARYDPNA